jgi:hypothetical protein
MVERGGRLRFALEAFQSLAVFGQVSGRNLTLSELNPSTNF